MTIIGQEEVWRIFMDGAANKMGSGVGVILISPPEEKIKLVVSLVFGSPTMKQSMNQSWPG